jgi:hypothetical protein
MITVYNCGQGDALRLIFPDCYWDTIPLYIDLGPPTFINTFSEPEIDLLITHSHDDHVLGPLPNSSMIIRDLYVPAYYPEFRKVITKLTRANINFPFRNCRNMVLLYDGVQIGCCSHNHVLNPPLDPLELFSLDDIDDQNVDEYLEAYGTSVEDILNTEEELPRYEIPDGYQAKQFVKAMVLLISSRDKGSLDKAIKDFRDYDENKMSIVFRYERDSGTSYLLTGDADKSVFKRLKKRNESKLIVDCLKLPHHGSKASLNVNILKYIAPSIAVVSHNNGLFGRATDPHPNAEVIQWLAQCKISAYYTNDVIKNAKTLSGSHHSLIPNCEMEIL